MAESHPVGAPLHDAVRSDSASEAEDEHPPIDSQDAHTTAEGSNKKKKKKRSKIAAAFKSGESSQSASKLSLEQAAALLESNPALKSELAHLPPSQAEDMLKKMDMSQLLTGLSINNKNKTDMASFKFWQTQPVPRFDEKPKAEIPDGPIKEVVPDQVSRSPAPLPEGYEWVELDMTSESEIEEVYKLLTFHYVEDDNAMFRFNYSQSFLDWALKSPDWKKSWHIGVRAKGPSRLLVASVFGIPTKLRVRKNVLDVVEINFLCIHKKLRGKRLTPVLIKEITRRCHLVGVYQAIYTAGVILPTPVGSCRYFHRPLDWLKLNEVGFSPLPPNQTKARMVSKNQLPPQTSTPHWREMRESDIDPVHDLLSRYLRRFDLAQELSQEEIRHWFLDKHQTLDQRVVWSFVVVDTNQKVTDFISFYCLESSVIGPAAQKHKTIRAAYLFYYASETAFSDSSSLKPRLNALVHDVLVEAKDAKFDVFNALTLHDNPMFLQDQKFGAGDGQLHYYLYNWRTAPVKGGVNRQNMPDVGQMGGVGMVLL